MADYDASYWQNQIKVSAKSLEKFHTAGQQVQSHYLDEESVSLPAEGLGAHKINMFWANVGILKSALYGNPPKPIAVREFQDPEDDVARVAASIIERLLKTGPSGSGADMHEAFKHAVEDRLLPGMGQVWLRYDAKTEIVEAEGVKTQRILDENVPCDYVFWMDFFYSPCRVWEECYWVARRVWMTKPAMEKRFSEYAEDIPLVIPKDGKSTPAGEGEDNATLKRGEIYEIWCKTTKKVHWIAKGLDEMLDEKPDPLEIPGFFPCPRPLVATTTTKKFIGRADYTMVQDQYAQLNEINIRLGFLVDACKAVGVYDKTADGVQRMFNQAVENQLIPIDNWAMFAEKGGIKGVVDWMPIEAIVAVIEKLREARVDCVQQIYELTGISDIMRGVTNARETYGAQQLKAQYSSSRLQLYQMEVGAFVAGAMDIKANIIAKHFQPETIVKKSLVMFTADREFAQKAIELIKNNWELMYRINVSSTQMSIPDYNAEKQMRQEYVTAMGQYVSQITPLVQSAPGAAPFLLKILQWAGASFATSGGVETLFDNYIRQVEKQLSAPPPPNPEVVKAQAEAKAKEAETQAKMGIAQVDAQAKTKLAEIEAGVKVQVANIEAASREKIAAEQAKVDLQIAEAKQTDLFDGTVKEIADEHHALELAKKEQDIANRTAEMEIQGVVDTALSEIKSLLIQYEAKMNANITKAKAESKAEEGAKEEKGDKLDVAAMQKMHDNMVATVSTVVEGLKSLSGKRNISITLPDGGKASAEVTQDKE